MNLELLDPFRRHLPDRIDATLSLPSCLGKSASSTTNNPEEDDESAKACHQVAYNRRGTYLAVSYKRGLVAVFDVLSRTLASVYHVDSAVTHLKWSRHARTLLVAFENQVQWIDATHPQGPQEACQAVLLEQATDETNERPPTPNLETTATATPHYSSFQTKPSPQTNTDDHIRHLPLQTVDRLFMEKDNIPQQSQQETVSFPHAIRGLDVHPHSSRTGLVVLDDGSLQLIRRNQQDVQTQTLLHNITAAAFSHCGQYIYAATTNKPTLLQYHLDTHTTSHPLEIPGGAVVWQIQSSKSHLLLNSADAALRLYTTTTHTLTWTFQDVVNKIVFVGGQLSGCGEYVVGAANNNNEKYELYIWSAQTGVLLDQLTGSLPLASVAWHPTRSFLAVATADGWVDVWGPRINWTAFAPDFNALKANVEYVEAEDEFDTTTTTTVTTSSTTTRAKEDDCGDDVDVVTIQAVPVFDSDSEDEQDVFCVEASIQHLLVGRKAQTNAFKPQTEET